MISLDEFLQDLENRKKQEFIFISYAHKKTETYNRVKLLAEYLRKRGVNVIYDWGGLPGGTNGSAFMELVLHEKRKYVLMVCDEAYLERSKLNSGGVCNEFQLLKDKMAVAADRRAYGQYIIPLLAEKTTGKSFIPDPFNANIYIEFLDDTDKTMSNIYNQVKICNYLLPDVYSNIQKEYLSYSKAKMEKILERKLSEAEEHYNNKRYVAACQLLKNISIGLDSVVKKKFSFDRFKYHNLRGMVEMVNTNSADLIEAENQLRLAIDELKGKEDTDKAFNKYACAYLNLSLACYYRRIFVDFLSYAKTALDYAEMHKELQPDFCIHSFNSNYALALWENDRKQEGLEEMKKSFEIVNNCSCEEDSRKLREIVQNHFNVSEMIIETLGGQDRKDEKLHDAEAHLRNGMKLLYDNWGDFTGKEKCEAFRIGKLVYGRLEEHYCNL